MDERERQEESESDSHAVDGLLQRFLDQAAGETRPPNSGLTDRIHQIASQAGPGSVTRSEPTEIGHYEILGRLGSGGMGTVYRARHSVLQRDVALKVLSSDREFSPNAVERFHREMRALASLN